MGCTAVGKHALNCLTMNWFPCLFGVVTKMLKRMDRLVLCDKGSVSFQIRGFMPLGMLCTDMAFTKHFLTSFS